MKRFGLIPMVVLAVFLPPALRASTFQNTDSDEYKHEATINGVPTYGTLHGNTDTRFR